MMPYRSGWTSVTPEEVAAFGAVSGGDGRIHTDPVYARTTRFGAPLVQGLYLLALAEKRVADIEPRWLDTGQLEATFVGPVRVGEDFLIEIAPGVDNLTVEVRTREGQAITGSAGIRSQNHRGASKRPHGDT